MDKLSEAIDRECHSPLGLFEKFKVEMTPDTRTLSDPDLQQNSLSESTSPMKTLMVPPTSHNGNKLILNKTNVFERMRWMMNTVSAISNQIKTFFASNPDPILLIFWMRCLHQTCIYLLSLFHNYIGYILAWEKDLGTSFSLREWQDIVENTARVSIKGNLPFRMKSEEESCKLLGSWNADSKEVEILDELESPSDHTEMDNDIFIQVISDEDDVIICTEDKLVSPKKANRARQTDNLQASDQEVKLGKRKYKKKTCDSENVNNSFIGSSGKPPTFIRNTTVQTLYEVLMKRVKERQDLDICEAMLKKLAKDVEEEIFTLYHDTGMRYKTKYRSLLFNLKNPKNKIFFESVVLGKISPQCLVQMSPTEMADQELTNWRNQERKHTLEMIERAEKELNQNQQMVKLTHKGLIEIDTTPDQMFTLEDLSNTPCCSKDLQNTDVQKGEEKAIDTTAQHKTHLLDLNCLICMGKIKFLDTMDMSQWTNIKSPMKIAKGNVEKLRILKGEASMENDVQCAKGQESSLSDSTFVWKGFIHMFAIKQFKVTAMQISGYSNHLCQELPKVITSKGFILQESVWEYMDLIWPACTKKQLIGIYQMSPMKGVLCDWVQLKETYCEESTIRDCNYYHTSKPMRTTTVHLYFSLFTLYICDVCLYAHHPAMDMCLLRFCPQTSSDAVFYSRLYSYLNRKLRYVIMNTNKMEAFIIPLPACQPIPSKLHPLGGPGLDDDHPHLLLGLLLPNHPSWSSCPRKVTKMQIEEELEVPDDIFSSILADVEREEKQMEEEGFPPGGQESAGVGEVGMPELVNILCLLSNNLQEIAQNNNNFNIVPPVNYPNPIAATTPVWPPYFMPPNFQAPASYGNNPSVMFDPSTMFGPSGFNPYMS